jgi:hypothetical protein
MSRPIRCPAGLEPWRDTEEGPMPLLVPAEQLARWQTKHPKLWIDVLPADIVLTGNALMPSDLWPERYIKRT